MSSAFFSNSRALLRKAAASGSQIDANGTDFEHERRALVVGTHGVGHGMDELTGFVQDLRAQVGQPVHFCKPIAEDGRKAERTFKVSLAQLRGSVLRKWISIRTKLMKPSWRSST